jgi:hypothetical protein
MERVRIHAALVAAVLLFPSAVSANVLINGNFESNPPATNGNHLGWSVAPWVVGTLGTSNQPNVVRVDGPGGFNYGSAGPESDASAPGAGIPQHYLDVAGTTNDFYQSFTPACDGDVDFGGSFSTRDNLSGKGSVAIRLGNGISGTLVGSTNVVSLPAGNSKTDPWKNVSFTVPVTAGTTYSFVVTLDANVNFDNGFVTYTNECHPGECMEVKVKEALCDKDGTFTVTSQVVNHTGHPVQYVLVAPPSGATYSVMPNVVPVTLGNGQSTGVTVTVTGATPGQQICLTYLLQDAEGRTCCSSAPRALECVWLATALGSVANTAPLHVTQSGGKPPHSSALTIGNGGENTCRVEQRHAWNRTSAAGRPHDDAPSAAARRRHEMLRVERDGRCDRSAEPLDEVTRLLNSGDH